MSTLDVQCQSIFDGLVALEKAIDQPLAEKALDVKNTESTSRNKKLLSKLRKALLQYVDRQGDLVYVATVGHFSAGKSSTLNSLLDLWDSKQERPTDLHPTDKEMTMIAHEKNASSLLSSANQGSIPVRFQTLQNSLLERIVLVDTPGTGDPQIMEEMARDLLPLCDLVLFVFSAASPLDITDRPILADLHKHLPFIPILFVITRADELRSDRLRPLSEDNFDATGFLARTISRLSGLMQPRTFKEEDFVIIDNLARFRIDSLKSVLLAQAAPENISSRLRMHSYKVHFFHNTALLLRSFFSGFLADKLKELTRIVVSADKNIKRYQYLVGVSNAKLTKSWSENLKRIQDLRIRARERVKEPKPLPGRSHELDSAASARTLATNGMTGDARWIVSKIKSGIRLSSINDLKDHIVMAQRELSNADLDILTPHGHGLVPPSLDWSFTEADLLPLEACADKADNVRRGLWSALTIATEDSQRMLDEVRHLIEKRTALEQANAIVAEAQSSLDDDINTCFEQVQVYRAGVFALDNKDAISKLGIGSELDLLEKDFDDKDREPVKLSARSQMFPVFLDITAKASTRFAELSEKTHAARVLLGRLSLELPPPVKDQLMVASESKRREIHERLRHALDREVFDFIASLQTHLSGAIARQQQSYFNELKVAKRERFRNYLTATLGLGVLSVCLYFSYQMLLAPVGRARLENVVLGIVANLVGDGVGFLVRYVSTSLRHSVWEFSEYCRLSFVVC
jgi:hypothetical protein